MKLKIIQDSVEVIALGKRYKGEFKYPEKVKVLPQRFLVDKAFYSYNKELRAKKGMVHPIKKAIYNFDFAGNGARGRYTHTKENLEKVAGNTNIIKKPKLIVDIEIDPQQVEEQSQLNFNGTELKGNRTTNAEEAKAFIRKYGGIIKYNRGEHFKSGRFSGGLLRRTYEAETNRQGVAPQEEKPVDEFTNLQEQIQEEQIKDESVKVGMEGM